MITPEQTTPLPPPTPPPEVEREVRFAVVMYGGVSLAIYINGVAQELLHMVRATARDPRTDAMLFPNSSGTEAVYRLVAQKLDAQLGSLPKAGDKASDADKEFTRTRFIVDVISGTSAGGINGVFLAKALARNQTMEGLKTLWLKEGDFGKLLNDTKAEDYSRDQGFAVQKPETSLLNSQRMYRKLLQALAEMNEKSPAEETKAEEEPSPLVTELDLFVTTTDIEGIPLPIQLADRVVYERRYRNVFHFRYARDDATYGKNWQKKDDPFYRDDFKKGNDPFLAFAARCTSSFPFAFEAMQLNDIDPILQRYRRYESDSKNGEQWDTFYKDYLRAGLIDIDKNARGYDADQSVDPDAEKTRLRRAFRHRSFGDGGYLDNKPFSYATALLMRRQADCVVDRKLLYVEPTPDHPELAPREPGPRPDFAANVYAAVLDLPRQETIREDIERVYERNEILKRAADLANYVDQDASAPDLRLPKAFTHPEFALADVNELIERYGPGYGAYHRLKVHEITELLACIVTRAIEHDPRSNANDAVRELVRMWRNDRYRRVKPLGKRSSGTDQESENQFLLDFDVHYRLRRLSFVSRRINVLAGLGRGEDEDAAAKVLLLAWLDRVCEKGRKRGLKKFDDLRQLIRDNKKNSAPPWQSTDSIPDPQTWLRDFLGELAIVKRTVIAARIQSARFQEEQFLDPHGRAGAILYAKITQLDLPWHLLEDMLSDDDVKKNKAIDAINDRGLPGKLDAIANTFRDLLDNRQVTSLHLAGPRSDPTKGGDAARLCLDHYYRSFLLYDLITYPIQYGTGAVDANIVNIYRVSPEDSPTLMEERPAESRDKLAGRTLMSFGAFLDERWRKNDMLWGRLDGSERIISVLLPDSNERKTLIRTAHYSILREEILQGNGDAVCALLSNALWHRRISSDDNKYVEDLVRELMQDPGLQPYLTQERRTYLVRPERIDRHLNEETALKYISRSTDITGNMLSGLAEHYQYAPGKRVGAWISRLGTVFWGMVAAAVPKSLGNLFYQHWLGLLYLLSFVTIVLGILAPGSPIKQVGWASLGVAVTLNLLVFLLGDFIAGGRRALRAMGGLFALIIAGLIGLGTTSAIEWINGFVANRWPQVALADAKTTGALVSAAAAALLLIGFALKKWSKAFRNFLAQPDTKLHFKRLFWLSALTAAIAIWLEIIGPPDMVDFEFAGTIDAAQNFVGAQRVTKQLVVDYFFIVAYVATLANYCAGASRVFFRALKSGKPNAAPMETQNPIVIAGFVLAALVCLAGVADAAENTGLLWFLNDQNRATGLNISFYCASLKFALIGLAGAYSAVAFFIGVFQKQESMRPGWRECWKRAGLRVLLFLFAVCSFGFAKFAFLAFWKHPEVLHDLVIKFVALLF